MKINKTFVLLSSFAFLAFCALLIGASVVYALGTWGTGGRSNAGSSDRFGSYNNTDNISAPTIKYGGVINKSGHNYFVPTKTITEYNAFCDNANNVTCCNDIASSFEYRGGDASDGCNYTCDDLADPDECGGWHYCWIDQSCSVPSPGTNLFIPGTPTDCPSGGSRYCIDQPPFALAPQAPSGKSCGEQADDSCIPGCGANCPTLCGCDSVYPY